MTKEKAEELSEHIRRLADWMVANHRYIDEESFVFNGLHDPIEKINPNGTSSFERGRVSYELIISEYDKYKCQRIAHSTDEKPLP